MRSKVPTGEITFAVDGLPCPITPCYILCPIMASANPSFSLHNHDMMDVSGDYSRNRPNKRKGRDGDDSEEEEKDIRVSTSKALATKLSRSSQETSRNMFDALVAWAVDPKARDKWAECNDEFMFCEEHLRLSDMYTKKEEGGCITCGYKLTGSRSSVEEDNILYHKKAYPMHVQYKPDDEAGRIQIEKMYGSSMTEVEAAQKQIEKLEENKPFGTTDDVVLKEARAQLLRLAAINHKICISYKLYAWSVADAIRQEWMRAGRLSSSDGPKPAMKPMSEPPPGANTPFGFLSRYNTHMLEARTRGSSADMWCFRHSRLGEWNMVYTKPERLEECGMCRKPKAIDPIQKAYEERMKYGNR